MKPVICLLGPTATGKTDLAIHIAHAIDAEIISVDSALVYRGMDIGTAKPSMAERQGIPHHLIDLIEPESVYSAAEFAADVARLIQQIHARGRRVVLVGGTMMYFNALFNGLSALPSADPAVRRAIEAQAGELGWPALHAQLAEIDAVAAERIKPTDPQRITRALEVYRLTGQNLTKLCATFARKPLPYPTLRIGLIPPNREALRARIQKRFELMLSGGFIDEVKQLYSRPCLDVTSPSMRCVGYRQVWQYLDGDYGYDVMVERGIIATRQLAKRQMTWLRGMKEIQAFAYDDLELQHKILCLIASADNRV